MGIPLCREAGHPPDGVWRYHERLVKLDDGVFWRFMSVMLMVMFFIFDSRYGSWSKVPQQAAVPQTGLCTCQNLSHPSTANGHEASVTLHNKSMSGSIA
jgi:hypothetical protein